MKTLLQLLLAQKLISSKCVLFQDNSLLSDTVPLKLHYPNEMFVPKQRVPITYRLLEYARA